MLGEAQLGMSNPTELLQELLASEIRGDLLVLFHRNPGLIDTLQGVARRIGKTEYSIEKDIQSLVKLGILKRKKIGTSEVIFLDRTRDHDVLESIANHLSTVKGGLES
jgi:predicted transcriptional regulator